MSFWRAPSKDELAIIAVAIIAFIVWKTVIDDSGGDATPVPVVTPAPATATAAATPTPVATAAPSPTATPTPAPAVANTDECDFGDYAENVRGAIVEVVADVGGDLPNRGTAFHVGGGDYVTAAHVIQDDAGRPARTITLRAGDQRLSATIDRIGSYSEYGTERDIAKLRAEPIDAALDRRILSEGDTDIDVRVFGYPWSSIEDGTLQTSRGVVSAVLTTDDGIAIVETAADVNRGMSGGPLVDECGNALAVVSFSLRTDDTDDPSEFTVFISISELDNLE